MKAQNLKELIVSLKSKSPPLLTFSRQELETATNNYAEDRDLGYNLYSGIDEQGRSISVKKLYDNESIINEVAVASQITNHNNILKLLGFCWETEFPTLVYEDTSNGPLFDHIIEDPWFFCCVEGRKTACPKLPWETRLRVTTEIADTLVYLHTATSNPIIHTSINPKIIYLNKDYVVKLSGFNDALWIPKGETFAETKKTWCSTFTAPEAWPSRRFTEKSDVYSFGLLSLEVLTGKETFRMTNEVSDSDLVEESEGAIHLFRRNWNKKDIEVYLNSNILKEGNKEQQMAFLGVALRCVKSKPEERPTMTEVVQELRQIKQLQPSSISCEFIKWP
uniref:Protein kinase domain-containing protein n=1 Tax=Nelumbo nucifera TaxID=4432 RepID=A0A822YCT3_NELNU|nr:TPA_asm: hypothetical protein HUJ06_030799 [Nelumbo nucifera]